MLREQPRKTSGTTRNIDLYEPKRNKATLDFFSFPCPVLFPSSPLPRGGLAFDEIQGLLAANAVDGAVLVPEENTVALISNMDDFRSEGGADELRAGFLRDRLQQSGDGRAVLGIQVRVDLVENDHGTRLGLL